MSQSYGEPIPTADTDEEWKALLASDAPNVIRSRADWDQAMADEGRRSSILPGCDEDTVKAFTDDLRFNDGGLAAADGTPLEDKLTVAEYKALWENFGAGSRLAADWVGYKCDGTHTCVASNLSHICTSNC
jgi:hypothetical protein